MRFLTLSKVSRIWLGVIGKDSYSSPFPRSECQPGTLNAFSVCFTCKVKEDAVKDKLASLKVKDIQKAADAKALAKDLLTGRETKIIARLSNSEGKMGRSLVIDLPTQGYR